MNGVLIWQRRRAVKSSPDQQSSDQQASVPSLYMELKPRPTNQQSHVPTEYQSLQEKPGNPGYCNVVFQRENNGKQNDEIYEEIWKPYRRCSCLAKRSFEYFGNTIHGTHLKFRPTHRCHGYCYYHDFAYGAVIYHLWRKNIWSQLLPQWMQLGSAVCLLQEQTWLQLVSHQSTFMVILRQWSLTGLLSL